MGYMTAFEQRQVLQLYGRAAECRCNYCRGIIWLGDLMVVDPKKGYENKPPGTPDFLPRKPKGTYHQACDDEKHGRKPRRYDPKQAAQSPAEIKDWVLEKLSKKGDWNRRKLVKVYPGQIDKALIRDAVRALKAEKKIKRVGNCLVLVEKSKKEKRQK